MNTEELLDCPYRVIDFLPKQVPADSSGQYFAVEKYLRTGLRGEIQNRKFMLILKLMCYQELTLFFPDTEETKLRPAPEELGKSMAERSVCLILKDAMITSDPDDAYMTLYHADEELLSLIKSLAGSEGFFVRDPEGPAE